MVQISAAIEAIQEALFDVDSSLVALGMIGAPYVSYLLLTQLPPLLHTRSRLHGAAPQ